MNQYTEILSLEAETLSLEDENYEDRLLEVSRLFRGFGEALSDFIKEHGYTGDLDDTGEKVSFLRHKFKEAYVKVPHNLNKWFVQDMKISRKTAFMVCFVFCLDVDETNNFFRCVLFERGFDCHNINEAVYYFCMRNGLSYKDAKDILKQIPVLKKVKKLPVRDVLYTGTIVEYINSIDDKQKLIDYMKEHIDDFQYNNATAITYIQQLWKDISRENGLAEKEGNILERTFNKYEDKSQKNEGSYQTVKEEMRVQNEKVRPDDYVIAGTNASTWLIFSQIIGLSNFQENEYGTQYDRSLTSFLSNNALMPLKADYCFPGRQSIDKLMRGELAGDDEVIRKMLIFLVFYTYWAKIIIREGDVFYRTNVLDSRRCQATINARLLDAGYPELYAGNPYDWLFMWALNDSYPLPAFRYYMGEVLAIKKENAVI